jgi:hypothetical protein
MHGDLSFPLTTRDSNFAGILEQQGRVSLDADTNAATAIALDWQDTEANDVIGSGVAAIPADAPNSFLVSAATVDGAGNVQIDVTGGRAWVDGILVRLDDTAVNTRIATYLQPPVVASPAPGAASIAAGKRDAIILEVWRDSLSSFQRPSLLLEPALGGPDTIERIHTSFDFRLLRLADGDDCGNLGSKLGDNLAAKGRLTVSLKATSVVPGPCPVNDAGGYTGFEHALYRIEIADVTAGAPKFKWSQFNGGLVGRGDFDGGAGIVTILSNLQPIITAGLPGFYLEALVPDTDGGGQPIFDRWRVSYGANVTLNANDELVLGATVFGTVPAHGTPTFFRLWNEIRACSDFPTGLANPNELTNGICLAFDPNAAGAYTPGDYWSFDVRAGNILIDPLIIGGVPVLVNNQPPEGIRCHRVSLGIVTWPGPMAVAGTLSDCREVFQPLTRLDTCCTFRVGDGVHSHGQFTSINTAVQHLPAAGGKICVLPGEYNEHVLIDGLENVTISGCGKRSRVLGGTTDPVFHIRDSWHITIEQLFIGAPDDANGILVDTLNGENRDIMLRALTVNATTASAIDVEEGTGVTIRDSFIEMADVATEFPAIFFVADNGLIERNFVRVDVQDGVDEAFGVDVSAGLGGIQLGGWCDRVHVVENVIQGGNGQGITLGSLMEVDDQGNPTHRRVGHPGGKDPCNPCRPGDGYVPPDDGGNGTHEVSAGPLFEIYIERNRISLMGLDGIGVVGFWDLTLVDEMVSVFELTIAGNEIRNNLQRELAQPSDAMLGSMGYGGISLADAEMLVVRHNVIEDNGFDFVQPVCGIFVLHGVGVDIADNRIRNNGWRTEEGLGQAKKGLRGGIIIVYAVAPTDLVGLTILGNTLWGMPVQNGVPALRVHDNVVNTPLGRALSVVALGPVSVQGNALGTKGVEPALDNISSDLIAATVFIFDLGLSDEIYLQLLLYVMLAKVTPSPDMVNESADALTITGAGLDDAFFARALADGTVMFDDNQVELDLSLSPSGTSSQSTGLGHGKNGTLGRSFTFSSVMIVTLDDVSFQDNQCVCTLLGDILLVNAMVVGYSVRVHSNRFTESLYLSLFSAITFGVTNMTTHNQATRCILALPTAITTVKQPNRILHPTAYCKRFAHHPAAGFLGAREAIATSLRG